MENRDMSNYSSSPHRMPTLSASQALQNLSSGSRKPIPTGLKSLDAILQGKEPYSSGQDALSGGLSRGQLTEIFGPPGVGKSTLAMQIAANALRSGTSVVWIDASYELVSPRFQEILSEPPNPDPSSPPHAPQPTNDLLTKFHRFTTPTLPHLLALLTHPAPSFPPPNTSLIIIDSLSTLTTAAFPKPPTITPTTPKPPDATHWAAMRKWPVLGTLVSKLSQLATTANATILLTTQTTTKIRPDTAAIAMLHPALSAPVWDQGIAARIVLFRDWLHHATFVRGLRFAAVVKANGILHEGLGRTIPFTIGTFSLHELPLLPPPPPTGGARMPKRKHAEIEDSQSSNEEDEFGWTEDVTEDFGR